MRKLKVPSFTNATRIGETNALCLRYSNLTFPFSSFSESLSLNACNKKKTPVFKGVGRCNIRKKLS